MKFFAIVVAVYLLGVANAYSQDTQDPLIKGKNDTIRIALTEVEGELIPWLPLRDVYIYNTRLYKSPAERARLRRLRYNVLKVLPYAMFARERYNRLHEELSHTKNRKEHRKLIKACEKEIKDMFNREIKNMTISQGEILIKLIDRETGNSSFQMVKELKGGFSAFFYQSVARVFGHNLKNEYNAEQEREIEEIIQSSMYYRYN
jgi:hypothetical protein